MEDFTAERVRHFLGHLETCRGNHIRCPYYNHEDRHPSWRLMDDGRAVCSCRKGRPHSVFDVIAELEGCDFEMAKIRAAEILGRLDLIVDPAAEQAGLTLADYAAAKRLPVEFLHGFGWPDVYWLLDSDTGMLPPNPLPPASLTLMLGTQVLPRVTSTTKSSHAPASNVRMFLPPSPSCQSSLPGGCVRQLCLACSSSGGCPAFKYLRAVGRPHACLHGADTHVSCLLIFHDCDRCIALRFSPQRCDDARAGKIHGRAHGNRIAIWKFIRAH